VAQVTINNLTYTYPLTEEPALREISIEIQAGEFLAVIGANGAGKTTLCYTLSGFIPHFFRGELQGKILIDGLDTANSKLYEIVEKVGLAFQNPFNQISGSKFTVYEEIAFGLENLGLPRDEIRSRVEWILALTGIEDLAERSPYALSGGQQQKVALASILVMKPGVLVLDEPTSQLDPIGTREVFQVIRSLAHSGQTIILAEHKMEWIAEFADRVLVLDKGEIVRLGTPQQVLSDINLLSSGIGLSRYTRVAHRVNQQKLWPKGQRYPISLQEATEAFGRLLSQEGGSKK
jgi:energy-coupling factor transporter ATP-binding protein EcfA2